MDATYNSYHRSGWWHSHWLAYVLRIYWKSKESQSWSTFRRSTEFLGTKFQRKYGFRVRQPMQECIGRCRVINLFSVQPDSWPSAEICRHYTQCTSVMLRPEKIPLLKLLSSFYFRSGGWQSAVLYITSSVAQVVYIYIYKSKQLACWNLQYLRWMLKVFGSGSLCIVYEMYWIASLCSENGLDFQ